MQFLTGKQVASRVTREVVFGLTHGFLAFILRLQLIEIIGQLAGAETGDLMRGHEGLENDALTLDNVLEPGT